MNKVHIGKRSAGWKFSVHAIDRDDTWAKIRERVLSAHSVRDEYGDELTPVEMVSIVEGWQEGNSHVDYDPENSWLDPEGFVMSEGEFS